MPKGVRWLGAVLSGIPALLFLLLLLRLLWSVGTGAWRTEFNWSDAAWPIAFYYLVIAAYLLAVGLCALACAWCGVQWWKGHSYRAKLGSWACLIAGVLLFPISGGVSPLLMLPALTLVFLRKVH